MDLFGHEKENRYFYTPIQGELMNEGEKKVVSKMIAIYCHALHHPGEGLCDACTALRDYALQRLERCPFGDDKPTCGNCPIHCYRSDMRLKIKAVMRYAGPRMMFRHPLDTLRHFYRERRRDRNFAARVKQDRE